MESKLFSWEINKNRRITIVRPVESPTIFIPENNLLVLRFLHAIFKLFFNMMFLFCPLPNPPPRGGNGFGAISFII